MCPLLCALLAGLYETLLEQLLCPLSWPLGGVIGPYCPAWAAEGAKWSPMGLAGPSCPRLSLAHCPASSGRATACWANSQRAQARWPDQLAGTLAKHAQFSQDWRCPFALLWLLGAFAPSATSYMLNARTTNPKQKHLSGHTNCQVGTLAFTRGH